jgi:hypothetical protein
VMEAVSKLLVKNELVIKELRTRQPVISKIDEKLLVEVAGIERNQAEFLCKDFKSYWRTPSPWSGFAQGAERVAASLRLTVTNGRSAGSSKTPTTKRVILVRPSGERRCDARTRRLTRFRHRI